MKRILNAMKLKFNYLKENPLVRTVLISAFAILLIFSVTLAWYINNLGVWGIRFNTGNIDFNAYIYDENGVRLTEPLSSKEETESKYINSPLITLENAQVNTTGVAYIAVESTGSIGIQYKIAFDVTGLNEKSTVYLGGYKYNISKVTDKVGFSTSGNLDVKNCPAPEKIAGEVVTIDRNPISGMISQKDGYEVYRLDYTLVNKNEEYTGNDIKIYFNIFATQIGGDFDSTDEKGYTYYCSTKEDIDRAKIEAYAGDIIKLSSNIVYYGDLVFNKPVHLETNDFTLTVNGNLMYDYVLGNDLRIDAGGLGRIVVQCTKEGVGGNFTIKAPLSDVVLIGANSSNGDIEIEKNFTVDATNSVGSPGVSFNNVRIVDKSNARKTVLLESNTRATVSFGTTISTIQSVVKANNIEIVNNGVIDYVDISPMALLPQTNSPQIYILNNNDINQPIYLPSWAEKFEVGLLGICTGNTRIIQSISGSPMTVTGNSDFKNRDIEIEKKNVLVEQIKEGNDSRLKIYYQDLDGQTNTIRSILENYFATEATTDCILSEVLQLEIISIGDKAITNADITFLNSNTMLSLEHLDMERAGIYDTVEGVSNRLPDRAFANVNKYKTLVLPQVLTEIGTQALSNTTVENIITVPAEVAVFGTDWFKNSDYVYFASSVPLSQAVNGLTGVDAIFVDEAYINSYKNVYSKYSTQIYPMSVLDETKQHFVRNTQNNDWEITYHISGEEPVIGENVTIDGKVLNITSVYDNAYRHHYNMSEVKLADTVEHLGAGNFYNNTEITYVDLNNLKTLGDHVFYRCTNLAQVDFGTYLETIGAEAFYNCVSLTQEVILPATMQTVGISAFSESKITGVNTGGAATIGSRAFFNCNELIYAELPSVTTIGEEGANFTFSGCSSLVSLSLPRLSKVNGYQMLKGCSSLREMYMAAKDDGVSLGSDTFDSRRPARLKLYVPEELLEFYQGKLPGGIPANMIYPQGEKLGQELLNGFNIGQYIVSNNGDDTYTLITSNLDHADRYTVPNNYNGKPITAIFANAFRNQSFTNVTLVLGDNIQSIGNSAFYGSSGLVDVEFGNSLEVIGSSAFAYCSKLSQELELPASMVRIENSAFANSAILGIQTGGTASIGDRAFEACSSLIYAQFPQVTTVSEGGNNSVFLNCTSLVSVEMPKLAKAGGYHMFKNCTALTELYMGSKDANVSIGSDPFPVNKPADLKLYVPEELVSFYQGRNIVSANQVFPIGEKMGDKAVNGFLVGDYIVMENGSGYTLVTSNLDYSGTVELPQEYKGKPITEIYANAFRNQTFTNVKLELGEQISVIGNGAFYGASGLTSVVMDNVVFIGSDAFCGSGLKVLNAPKVTYLGNNAFRKCTNLGTVNLPKIEHIDGTYAFAECTNLKSVYFESIMSAADTTFYRSTNLEKITINRPINSNGDNLPAALTIEASAPCKIYVPYRSVDAYPNPWSGKPVVSFDITARYQGNTYILGENNEGRYVLIDFMPSATVSSLELPATVTADSGEKITLYAIKGGAFSSISGTLKNITLSSSVGQLENTALAECRILENVYVAPENVYFTSIDGVLFSRDARMLVKYPVGRSGQFDMTGSGYELTVAISAGAFENAAELTGIRFPMSLLVIDSTAFANCAKLRTVEFTGETPPTLMGTGIFDTGVDGFQVVIPTEKGDVVEAYLCAMNFAEYEPYMDLGAFEALSGQTMRNRVFIGESNEQKAVFSVAKPGKEEDEEEPQEDDFSGGDDPDAPDPAEGMSTPDEPVDTRA